MSNADVNDPFPNLLTPFRPLHVPEIQQQPCELSFLRAFLKKKTAAERSWGKKLKSANNSRNKEGKQRGLVNCAYKAHLLLVIQRTIIF